MKRTLEELNEQYKNCPIQSNVYEIDGKLYAVTSHFVGKKDVDKVLFNIAFKKAFEESEQG
ncbi:MAG: hypothetical protein NC320_08810 [Clostridium sp.]|nr:hypothetical protein [Clostridium sp.]